VAQPDGPAGHPCAPSFLDTADADDRLIVVHSFSKSFLMTGWRLGWVVFAQSMAPAFVKLIDFNTSCAPVFVQQAGLGLAPDLAFGPEGEGWLR